MPEYLLKVKSGDSEVTISAPTKEEFDILFHNRFPDKPVPFGTIKPYRVADKEALDSGWICTYSGKKFRPFDPRPEDIELSD